MKLFHYNYNLLLPPPPKNRNIKNYKYANATYVHYTIILYTCVYILVFMYRIRESENSYNTFSTPSVLAVP